MYILECRDGSYYTGYTNHLDRRVQVHTEGRGAKYTRSRLPVKLVYVEEAESKSAGLKREYEIKCLSHEGKKRLIQTGKGRNQCEDAL